MGIKILEEFSSVTKKVDDVYKKASDAKKLSGEAAQNSEAAIKKVERIIESSFWFWRIIPNDRFRILRKKVGAKFEGVFRHVPHHVIPNENPFVRINLLDILDNFRHVFQVDQVPVQSGIISNSRQGFGPSS